jgi:hypothetical protein
VWRAAQQAVWARAAYLIYLDHIAARKHCGMPPKAPTAKAKAALGAASSAGKPKAAGGEKTSSSAQASAHEAGLPARKENKPPLEKKEVVAKKTSTTGSAAGKGGAKVSPVAAYDALEYIAPLPPGAERPASTQTRNLFDEEDRWTGLRPSRFRVTVPVPQLPAPQADVYACVQRVTRMICMI